MRVLITGASGNLGVKLTDYLRQAGYDLVLLDRVTPPDARDFICAELSQWDEAWVQSFRGCDAVVHLAANGSALASWSDLLAPNLDAMANVCLASAKSAVPRLILASSVWAMAGRHGADHIDEGDPDPGNNAYGATKVFAERLGRSLASAYGLTSIALRIGSCRSGENEPFVGEQAWENECWLSNHDFCAAVECALTAEVSGHLEVNLRSDVPGSRWANTQARSALGARARDQWKPQAPSPAPAPRPSPRAAGLTGGLQHLLRPFPRHRAAP